MTIGTTIHDTVDRETIIVAEDTIALIVNARTILERITVVETRQATRITRVDM